MTVVLSSLYNAPLQYFTKLLLDVPVVIDAYEQYVKQTYRNRCLIYSADGAMSLSIPVNYSSTAKEKMRDIKISYQTNWVHLHWNAIVSAYNSTPFFEYYRDDFERVYYKKPMFLLDFNNDLLATTLKYLKINDKVNLTQSTAFVDNTGNDILDYRTIISPKKQQNDPLYRSINYYQIFSVKQGFLDNLSVLDLLFNMGNESKLILQNSVDKSKNNNI